MKLFKKDLDYINETLNNIVTLPELEEGINYYLADSKTYSHPWHNYNLHSKMYYFHKYTLDKINLYRKYGIAYTNTRFLDDIKQKDIDYHTKEMKFEKATMDEIKENYFKNTKGVEHD